MRKLVIGIFFCCFLVAKGSGHWGKVNDEGALSDTFAEEEGGIMNLMRIDSIDIYFKYIIYRGSKIDTLDKRIIEDWKAANADILDDELIHSSAMCEKIDRRNGYDILYPNAAQEILFENLKRSVKWRCENADKRITPGNYANNEMDKRINALRIVFEDNSDIPSMIKTVFLSIYERSDIDVINFLNGSQLIDTCKGSLDIDELDMIKDWWWANKGKVPDEVYEELLKSMLLDVYMAFEGEKDEFEEFKKKRLSNPDFDKYRGYDIIRME